MTNFRTLWIATGLLHLLSIGCAMPKPRPLSMSKNVNAVENVSRSNAVNSPETAVRLTSFRESTTDGSDTGIVVAVAPPPSVLTMDELVSLALANNPSIQELQATTQKAAGFKTQVGLKPNPVVGYQATQLADRGTDQHVIFGEQELVTANKLELNRRVLNESLRTQLHELEAQKLRVETDVKIAFYRTLALQKQQALIEEFRGVTERGFEITQKRQKAAEVSKVDVLQAQVQKNEMELASRQNQSKLEASWRQLVALTGLTDLPLTKLDGELPIQSGAQDWQSLQSQLINASPEYAAAQANISRARAEIERHEVQAVPNLTVQLGPGYDNGTNSGMLNLQVGAPIPVFNQNQGNLAAARAEYCRAIKEAQRIESSIKSRLAEVSGEYEVAVEAVKQYQDLIIPATRESRELAELAYNVGELGFVQTLLARRSYFDANLQLVQSQAQLATAQSRIDGILLTGALDPVSDRSGSDTLRGLSIGQR